MHILLIEPDRILAQVYVRAFEQDGHMVAHARSAQMAVQLADTQQPDIVVLELQLPQHNGVEFLYEFRSYGEWLRIPIVVHTYVPPSELTYAATLHKELGVQTVLYKPETSLERLRAAVRAFAELPV